MTKRAKKDPPAPPFVPGLEEARGACFRKVRFGSPESAGRGHRRTDKPLFVYRCAVCDGFHVSSMPAPVPTMRPGRGSG